MHHHLSPADTAPAARWGGGPITADSPHKRAAMARFSGLLFISGACLGVASLLLPGDPGRNSPAILATALSAYAIAVIPLYAPPQIFVYKKALQGASKSNNPTSEGPTWNLEQWHW